MFRRDFLKLSSALPFVGLIKDKEEKPNSLLTQGWIGFYKYPSRARYGFHENCEIEYGSKTRVILREDYLFLSQHIKNWYTNNKDGDILISVERAEKCDSKHWCETFNVFKLIRCECVVEKDYFDISGMMIRSHRLVGIKYPLEQFDKLWCPLMNWDDPKSTFMDKRKEEIIKSFIEGYYNQ